MSFARDILAKASSEYGFDFEQACAKFSLKTSDLPVPISSAQPASTPTSSDDMISTLLQATGHHVDTSTPIPRKRAARLTAEEKAEREAMRNEEKALRKEINATRREQNKKAQKQLAEAKKSANKSARAARRQLDQSVREAQKAVKLAAKVKKQNKSSKRAPTAYIIFSNQHRSQVRDEMPHLPAKAVVSELARRWRELSEEQKQPFVRAHLEAKALLSPPQQDVTLQHATLQDATLQDLDQEATVEEYLRNSASDDDQDDQLEVEHKIVDGTTYLISPSTFEAFDAESQELVGIYDPVALTITSA